MAEQIEINIHLNGDVEDGDVVGNGGSVLKEKTKTPEINAKKLGKYVSSQTLEVFLDNTKNIISQNIGLVTGKTELEQRVNFGLELAQKTTSTYKNAQAGAVMFQSMGLSAGMGAVVGVALSVISTVINYGFKQAQLNLNRGIENRQIAQTRSRAGAGFNRSREGK